MEVSRKRLWSLIDSMMSVRVSLRMNGAEQNPILVYLCVLVGGLIMLRWVFKKAVVPWLYPILKRLFRWIFLSRKRLVLPNVNFADPTRHTALS